jgi:hypothetical protein
MAGHAATKRERRDRPAATTLESSDYEVPQIRSSNGSRHPSLFLNDHLILKMATEISHGVSLRNLPGLFGITRDRFNRWQSRGSEVRVRWETWMQACDDARERGEEPPEPPALTEAERLYGTFGIQIDKAKADRERKLTNKWLQHCDYDWMAAQRYLEQDDAKAWGKRQAPMSFLPGGEGDSGLNIHIHLTSDGDDGANAPRRVPDPPTYDAETVAEDALIEK